LALKDDRVEQCVSSTNLWEQIPNVGFKARESCAKAMTLAFVLLDFEHVGIQSQRCGKSHRV